MAKLGQYSAGVLFSFNVNQSGFHLTRAVGIVGYIQSLLYS